MAAIRIPSSLRRYTDGRDTVVAQGQTVAEVLQDLERNHPGICDGLLDGRGVRRFVNLYVGDEDIRFLEGLDTKVASEDRVTILPGIAGG